MKVSAQICMNIWADMSLHLLLAVVLPCQARKFKVFGFIIVIARLYHSAVTKA